MNAIRTAGVAALLITAMLGCSGLATYQKLPEDQQDVLFQDIQNHPASYRVHQCPGLVVVEPKNDNRSIEVIGERCLEVDPLTAPLSAKDQRAGTFRSLVDKNNQPYAYVYWNNRMVRVGAREVDDNTMHVWYNRIEYGGP